MRTVPLLRACAALALGLLVLHGCHDATDISPENALAIVQNRLTVTGTGTGSGLVTSSPSGINCTITAGKAASTGCSALFNQNWTIQLTAHPGSGTAFAGWVQQCSGTGDCFTLMSTARTVTADFRKGPF